MPPACGQNRRASTPSDVAGDRERGRVRARSSTPPEQAQRAQAHEAAACRRRGTNLAPFTRDDREKGPESQSGARWTRSGWRPARGAWLCRAYLITPITGFCHPLLYLPIHDFYGAFVDQSGTFFCNAQRMQKHHPQHQARGGTEPPPHLLSRKRVRDCDSRGCIMRSSPRRCTVAAAVAVAALMLLALPPPAAAWYDTTTTFQSMLQVASTVSSSGGGVVAMDRRARTDEGGLKLMNRMRFRQAPLDKRPALLEHHASACPHVRGRSVR